MSAIAVTPGFGTTRPATRRPARRPAPASAVPAPVRLTRRGRLVLLAVFVVLVFTALTMSGGWSAATGESGAPVETRTVEIGDGDTLWGIASTVAEPGEVREMIHRIEELNALRGVAVVEGQEIVVPVG
ncbi:MAG TPA: hypothetical protein VFD59_09185 [Nocardioidaceae bacterium]|nr:hypothetical protein [Nocardioidaceae bacterium]